MNDNSPQSFRDQPNQGEALMRFSLDSADLEAEQHQLIMRAFADWPDDLAGQFLALRDLLQILDVIEERSQLSVNEVSSSLPQVPAIA